MLHLGVTFAMTIVRHRVSVDKFALVDEGPARGWWIPGGGVDGHENVLTGAVREVQEEAGTQLAEDQLRFLSLEISPGRLRYFFYAVAQSESLKTQPDEESRGAVWATLEETSRVPKLRSPEPLFWFGRCQGASGYTGFEMANILDHYVEPNTTGIPLGKRQGFSCTVQCLFVCNNATNPQMFLTSMNPHTEMHSFPSVTFDLEEPSFTGRVLMEARKLNLVPKGVVMIHDHRDKEHQLDLRVAFYCEPHPNELSHKDLKWATELEDKSDRFAARVLELTLANDIKPLSVVFELETEQ